MEAIKISALAAAIFLAISTSERSAVTADTKTSAGEDSLAEFTTRALVSWRGGNNDANSEADYELEETYDKRRQLSKLIAHQTSGQRVEVYIRRKENLYLAASYSHDGELLQCSVSDTMPETNGILKPFIGLLHEIEITTGQPLDRQLLVGPSAILELFQHELRANWESKQRMNRQIGIKNLPDSGSGRILLSPEPIKLSLPGKDASSPHRATIEFWQPDHLIARAPLLNELAGRLRYISSEGEQLVVEYFSIDRADNSEELLRDPFRLPAGFECRRVLDSGPHERLTPSYWLPRMHLESSVASAELLEIPRYPSGIRWTLDMSRHRFGLEIPGVSRNIFDLHHRIIYHMAYDVAFDAQAAAINGLASKHNSSGPRVRNLDCSILSFDSLMYGDSHFEAGFTSEHRWRNLVGRPESMMYLGRDDGPDGSPAHLFSLSYKHIALVPAYLLVMLDQDTRMTFLKQGRLVARLRLVVGAECGELYGDLIRCDSPKLLGIRLELVDEVPPTSKQEISIRFSQFSWEPDETGSAPSLTEALDSSRCPFERLQLSLQVDWSEVGQLGATMRPDLRTLNEVVAYELINYLDAHANSEVALLHLEEEFSHPGIKSAQFRVQVGQVPSKFIGFESCPMERVAREDMKSALIYSRAADLAPSPLECLTWASELDSEFLVVLYSASKGCLVFRELVWENSGKQFKDDELFWMYFQNIVPREPKADGKTQGLDSFKSTELQDINKEIARKAATKSNLLVQLDDRTFAKNVRLGFLRLVDQQASAASKSTASEREIIKLLKGYKFTQLSIRDRVISRRQFETLSLTQCSNVCHSETSCVIYSHCHVPESGHQYCQLSDLDVESVLAKASLDVHLTRDSNCEIYIKDFLSYYELLPNLERWSTRKNNWFEYKSLGISQRHQQPLEHCAEICLIDFGKLCLRFAHLNPNQLISQPMCLLYMTGDVENADGNRKLAPILPGSDKEKRIVSLGDSFKQYRRQALTLYQPTISLGSLEWVKGDGSGVVSSTLSSLDASECADKCLARYYECDSFDACQLFASATEGGEMSLQDLECVLLQGSQLDGSISLLASSESNDTASRRVSRSCVHYEGVIRIQQTPRDEITKMLNSRVLDPPRPSLTGYSYVASIFIAACVGLALGVGANRVAVLWRTNSCRQTG